MKLCKFSLVKVAKHVTASRSHLYSYASYGGLLHICFALPKVTRLWSTINKPTMWAGLSGVYEYSMLPIHDPDEYTADDMDYYSIFEDRMYVLSPSVMLSLQSSCFCFKCFSSVAPTFLILFACFAFLLYHPFSVFELHNYIESFYIALLQMGASSWYSSSDYFHVLH